MTQEEAAHAIRSAGQPWTVDTVQFLETGRGGSGPRAGVTVQELTALSVAFGVTLASWFDETASWSIATTSPRPPGLRVQLRLSDNSSMDPSRLRDLMRGEVPIAGDIAVAATEPANATDFSDAETRAARRLRMTPSELRRLAQRLWGRTLDEERDERVARLRERGPGVLRALRGHVTRELTAELTAAGVDDS